MSQFDICQLKQKARDTLKDTQPDYRKLVALHTAVSLGVTLIVMAFSLLISSFSGNSGGLSGMATGAMLNTSQSLLNMAVQILLPFWNLGILFTSVQVVRRQATDFSQLTRGFSRFGPFLRYTILLSLILSCAAILCTNVISIYSLLVPPSKEVLLAIKGLEAELLAETIDPVALLNAISWEIWLYMFPMLLLFWGVLIAVLAPLLYRFRMCMYLLVDEAPVGARMSMGISNRMTSGYKWGLFKLDLSLWWYYLLQLVISVLAFGNDILAICGISLPISPGVSHLIFYGVYALATIALAYFAGGYVETTYACAYEELLANQRHLAVTPEPAVEDFGSDHL